MSKTDLGAKKQLIFKSIRIEALKKVLGPGMQEDRSLPSQGYEVLSQKYY